MRSFRAATAATALALSVLLVGTLAATSYADPQRPELPPAASDRAEEALQRAHDALSGDDRSIEPTLALRELFLLRGELTGEDREQADRLMARPDGQSPGTDPDSGIVSWKPRQEAPPVCNRKVCVHFVTSGEHAAKRWQARAARAAVTYSWRREIGDLRYRAPRKDGYRGNRRKYLSATRGRLDVYLADLGGIGAFGYAAAEPDPPATDDGNPSTATGYLVLDQDFAEFGCPSRADCRRVTAAHELFHLVQYAYSVMGPGDTWFLESTATWMEERVYDGINDNRNYVRHGQLGDPHVPLNYTYRQGDAHAPRPYGNWLVHEFYTQRLGNVVVRRAWRQAARGRGWQPAMGIALRQSGWRWSVMYPAFAAGNNIPGRTYDEGWAYRKFVKPPATGTFGTGLLAPNSATLQPFSSRSYRFTPSTSTGSQLTIEVDLEPGRNNRAYVVVQTAGNGLRRSVIPVDADGNGVQTFPFASDDVRYVNLTLVNGTWSSAEASYEANS